MSDIKENVLNAIGNTPLVKLNKINVKNIEIYVKLEYYSPGMSIKDRIALGMIEDAERKGLIEPGDTIIGKTSGNTGIGLAIACAVKGYRFVAVMSAGNSAERQKILRALGAEVVLVPQQPGEEPGRISRKDNDAVEKKTQELTEKLNAYRPNQYINSMNWKVHQHTTGQEIIRQTSGRLDAFVAYIGTGGTFVGIARALKSFNNDIKCYPVEPGVAAFLAGKKVITTQHLIQGGGHAVKPPFWDESIVDGYIQVSEDEAIKTARALAKNEGILTGFSGGANVAAAAKLDDSLRPGSIVVTVLPDTGLKYLSTVLYE
ncbi:PLP-dependent cysteine synthase family protein [Picrophilus oshimae]|uniref:Cysteine synthase A n=1 Tax=Picrophilus torridus (strain ATCC 700027 / DSM 9790 / JCM 10055 / NBRC 100828 / KAW 2/3) TaxID=1122961 RepID=A0A8G2FXX9_PICTO|nr:cysteine synthase family protein [Picrophilus oshimae]SMD31524.1 cysteine synthase A [Picrophilus oshimae DSM 9789]